MPFKKGQSGNPNGRSKGTPNKVTHSIKEKFIELLESVTIEELKGDLKKLDPKDRLQVIAGLSEYIVPKLNRSSMDITVPDDSLVFKMPKVK